MIRCDVRYYVMYEVMLYDNMMYASYDDMMYDDFTSKHVKCIQYDRLV